jgi:citrate lyase gamma subunit
MSILSCKVAQSRSETAARMEAQVLELIDQFLVNAMCSTVVYKGALACILATGSHGKQLGRRGISKF